VLQVDLALNDRELQQLVTALCASFGVVRSVKIHRSPSPFAMVEMASHQATMEIAAQYGGSAFGTAALVHLEQDGSAA